MQSPSTTNSKALLDHGADIYATTDQDTTALNHGAESCNTELVAFLPGNGANVHARAAREERPHSSIDTTVIIKDNTPLHLAVASSSGVRSREPVKDVTALLDHGADIEARESFDKTSLPLVIVTDFYRKLGLLTQLKCFQLLLVEATSRSSCC
jgi:ankyrin repeat protein